MKPDERPWWVTPPFAERVKDFPEIALWHPASGYLNKWRVVRETERGLQELETANGKRVLFKTMGAAQRRADTLNLAA